MVHFTLVGIIGTIILVPIFKLSHCNSFEDCATRMPELQSYKDLTPNLTMILPRAPRHDCELDFQLLNMLKEKCLTGSKHNNILCTTKWRNMQWNLRHDSKTNFSQIHFYNSFLTLRSNVPQFPWHEVIDNHILHFLHDSHCGYFIYESKIMLFSSPMTLTLACDTIWGQSVYKEACHSKKARNIHMTDRQICYSSHIEIMTSKLLTSIPND